MSEMMICPKAGECIYECEHNVSHSQQFRCVTKKCLRGNCTCIPYPGPTEVEALAMRLRCVAMFAFYRVGKRTPPRMTEWKALEADLKAAYMAQAKEALKMRGAK